MDERFVKYSYDGSFDGNILIVGRTGCGKMTFIQKIAQNKMFGKDMFFGFQKFILVLKEKKVLENVLLNKMSSLLILVT